MTLAMQHSRLKCYSMTSIGTYGFFVVFWFWSKIFSLLENHIRHVFVENFFCVEWHISFLDTWCPMMWKTRPNMMRSSFSQSFLSAYDRSFLHFFATVPSLSTNYCRECFSASNAVCLFFIAAVSDRDFIKIGFRISNFPNRIPDQIPDFQFSGPDPDSEFRIP